MKNLQPELLPHASGRITDSFVFFEVSIEYQHCTHHCMHRVRSIARDCGGPLGMQEPRQPPIRKSNAFRWDHFMYIMSQILTCGEVYWFLTMQVWHSGHSTHSRGTRHMWVCCGCDVRDPDVGP